MYFEIIEPCPIWPLIFIHETFVLLSFQDQSCKFWTTITTNLNRVALYQSVNQWLVGPKGAMSLLKFDLLPNMIHGQCNIA